MDIKSKLMRPQLMDIKSKLMRPLSMDIKSKPMRRPSMDSNISNSEEGTSDASSVDGYQK